MNNYLKILYQHDGAKLIVETFEKSDFSIRFVGGSVRNLLLNLPFDEIDFVTNAHPEESIKLLKQQKIKTIPTGIKHGTITALIGNNSFEITTLRRDVDCDGRHAIVEFSDNYEDDARRRDFTINAMSISSSGELFDYFNGKEDLANGLIKFVGNPYKRAKEDYLRILRFYRFYSYYGKIADINTLNACKELAENIKLLSLERIRSEFGKILISPKIIFTLELMYQNNALGQLLSITRLETKWLDNLLEICKKNNIQQNFLRNLITIIYHEQSKTIPSWIISNSEKKYFKTLLNYDLTSKFSSDSLSLEHYSLGTELFTEMNLLKLAIHNERNFNLSFDLVKNCPLPIFPVKGEDLLELGILPGKNMGEILKSLEMNWINSNFSMTKQELLKIFIK